MFMTDRFWPHVHAEAGWLGHGFCLLAVDTLIAPVWQRARTALRTALPVHTPSALFGHLLVLSVSLTSAVLTSVFALLLISTPVGAVVVRGRAHLQRRPGSA
jgi:hypothetical protein